MSKNNANELVLHPQIRKIRAMYNSCIMCNKELEAKRLRNRQLRCKKCQRDYEKMWPASEDEFMKMFEGQH